MLKDNILPCPISWVNFSVVRSSPVVARGVQDKREVRIICIALNFFNDCHACTCLLMQDDWLKLNCLNKASNLLLHFIVSAVDNENLSFVACYSRLFVLPYLCKRRRQQAGSSAELQCVKNRSELFRQIRPPLCVRADFCLMKPQNESRFLCVRTHDGRRLAVSVSVNSSWRSASYSFVSAAPPVACDTSKFNK